MIVDYFFYAIMIHRTGEETHKEHLRLVLQILEEYSLLANKKCNFGQRQLEILGHLISKKVVRQDPNKIRDMITWPILSDMKRLRGLLGLTSY